MKRNSRFLFPTYPIFSLSSSGERLTFQKTIGGHSKKARLEQLEPMEVVQYYMNRYHKAMEALNVLPPSIEPHASGHIIEQIDW